MACKNHHEYTTNAATRYYEPQRINRIKYESTSTVVLRTPRIERDSWQDFLTVKNILHERHECPEPTRSVENHSQMSYVSLRVLRMCHE